ncbi:class I SAM-dependent methyltransferase [Alteribacillus sp. HJP-4]|uniref:class I SAM-dependent methyltransferase n=1 Tax=Alteribacillus sp. HJP-4 TaxID=2775394 RepID=UPI0035CD2399
MSKTKYYEQIGVAMTCRSFQEYKEMFMLEKDLLEKGRILDVASGASSFVTELNANGFDATAVDPLYRLTHEEMKNHGKREVETAAQKIEMVKHQFVWNSYKNIEAHHEIRKNSLEKFLAGYQNKENYIPAALPDLPFENDTFSLVVCNHFLFLYQEQFGYDFHLQAVNELIRVTKPGGIIRIYPLVGFKNEPYPFMDELMNELEIINVTAELLSTSFRFLPAATQFLNIYK